MIPALDLRLDEWKQRLIDLTRRNRLLYFRPTKASTLSITAPEAETIFDRLYVEEKHWNFWLPSAVEPNEEEASTQKVNSTDDDLPTTTQGAETANADDVGADELVCAGVGRKRLEATLKNIFRKAHTDYQERGVRILHLAFGELAWKETEASDFNLSPLVLCPVELRRETASDPYELHWAEEDAVLNPALLAKLRSDFRIELPPAPDEWETAALTDYLAATAAKARALGWEVRETVYLGMFSFHKLGMYQDLAGNAERVKSHAIVRGLAGEALRHDATEPIPDLRELDKVQKPQETFQILDADSSQQQCIQAALAGRSLVLQGPPGTGKSQTIANIVAEFIARGKTVLFVSEKMAALEVVFKRLRDAHLDDFCLELHSHKANKREVVAELKRSLDVQLAPTRLPAPADFERIERTRAHLNDYVQALHTVREPLGVSAFDALSQLAQLDGVPLVPAQLADAENLRPARIEEWEALMRRLVGVWQVVEEGEEFPFYDCTETRYELETRAAWITILKSCSASVEALARNAQEFAEAVGVETPADLAACEWLAAVGSHLNAGPAPDPSWLTTGELDAISKEADEYRLICADYWNERNALATGYEAAIFDVASETGESLRRLWECVTSGTGDGGGLADADGRGQHLVRRRYAILNFLRATSSLVRDVRRDAQSLSRAFGLPLDSLNVKRARELAGLALLCATEAKPEASWLNPARLQQAREAAAKFAPLCEVYNRRRTAYEARRARLLERYDASFLELPLDELIERFSGLIYRTPLRFLSPFFRRNKRAILRTSRTPALAPDIANDLLEARELVRLRAQLLAEAPPPCELFGVYDRGAQTDFEHVTQALKTAAAVLELTGADAGIPAELVKAISFGSLPSVELRVTSERLLTTISTWEAEQSAVSDLVPVSRLPQTQLGIGVSSLAGIESWLAALTLPLTALSQHLDALLPLAKRGEQPDLATLIADLKRVKELSNLNRGIEAESDRLRRKFGRRYMGVHTTWGEVLAAIEWTNEMRRLFDGREMTSRFVEIAAQRGEQTPLVNQLLRSLDEARESICRLEERFEPPAPSLRGRPLRDFPFAEIVAAGGRMAARIDELQAWIDYRRLEAKFAEAGLRGVLVELKRRKPPGVQLVSILRKSIYQAWWNRLCEMDERLGEFRARAHEDVIREFRETDADLVRLSAQRIVQICDARRPQGTFLQAQDSEIAVLRREAAKRRRHLPVRSLFDAIPNLLLKLKPCLLMSPLSVSQFLQTERVRFDLTIFDEASQIFTEDAVGAIYRGAQLVVAGDSQQLPPTDFFRSVEVDESEMETRDGETEAVGVDSSADYASVLDECQIIGGMAVQSLRWHYRSRHESLIAFSNNRFYNGDLVTFPAALEKHPSLGLQFVHLADSVYDRGGKRHNLREAGEVADLVFEHCRRYPRKSLGVVAFSQAQMTAIEDEIERRRLTRREYEDFFKDDRLEGFFVKNLENVQGDERDVIIFSVGYGRDANGQMTMGFGPLNRSGGERRLNVAITRAREKVILVSSITAADINLNATAASGVLNLHRYLDYAERGAAALSLTHPQGVGEADSPLEIDIAGEIKRLGYDAVTQVGCSGYRVDIGVVDPAHPGRFLLGVECDGATYHSAYTARDRDRLRQQVLEKLGWHIHRIWSPDWVTKRQWEINRLTQALEASRREDGEAALIVDDHTAVPKAHEQPPERVVEDAASLSIERTERADAAETRALPGTTAYKVFQPPLNQLSYFEFHDPACCSEQCRLLQLIVEQEGPLHIDIAARRLAEAWGRAKVGSRMMSAVREAVRNLVRAGAVLQDDEFLWTPQAREQARSIVRTPSNDEDETQREIKHIPPQELQNAMALIVQHAVGISLESLIAETRRLFGFNRSGSSIKERLFAEFEQLQRSGLLSVHDGRVSLGKDV